MFIIPNPSFTLPISAPVDESVSSKKEEFKLDKYSPLNVYLQAKKDRNKALFNASLEILLTVALAVSSVVLLTISCSGIAAPLALPLAIASGVFATGFFISCLNTMREGAKNQRLMNVLNRSKDFKEGYLVYSCMDRATREKLMERAEQSHIRVLLDMQAWHQSLELKKSAFTEIPDDKKSSAPPVIESADKTADESDIVVIPYNLDS